MLARGKQRCSLGFPYEEFVSCHPGGDERIASWGPGGLGPNDAVETCQHDFFFTKLLLKCLLPSRELTYFPPKALLSR